MKLANPAVENLANLDYGPRTPTYADGAAFDSFGAEIPALDFAFQIEGEKPVADGGEERFAFLENITGPLYTHPLRRPLRRLRPAGPSRTPFGR